MKTENTEQKSSSKILSFFRKEKQSTPTESLKEAVDAYLEETSAGDVSDDTSEEETALLSNVLTLKDLDVTDIMIPRADIVGVEVSASVEELFELLTERQFSRLPVYKETLDEILGTIHIKDILAKMAKNEKFDIKSLTREAPIVSPAMHILDLVQLMRQERRHMVMVVDEYGGIDGLVTIGDIIEELLGDIDDEYDTADKSKIEKTSDNSFIVDARIYLEDLDDEIGSSFSDFDEDDVDTLGGLVSSLVGRLPSRGEIIEDDDVHAKFKILDADPRRVKRVLVTLIEPASSDDSDDV
ncbi:MAG: hemolysin family protein [Bdellovibrionales bacterium]